MSYSTERGTSLVEVIVSVGLFATVMIIGAGALVNMSKAHRQARVIRSVVENINLSLESMSREIRFGSRFYCADNQGNGSGTADCENGKGILTFANSDNEVVLYRLISSTLFRNVIWPTASGYAFESKDVTFDSLKFFVTGSGSISTDTTQPLITIVLKGTSIQGAVPFVLQTSVVARPR